MHGDPYAHANPLPTIIAWCVIIALALTPWIFFDFYLCPKYHWRMLTTEFRDGLNTPFGCFILGSMALVVVTFTTHMLNVRTFSR